MFAPQMDLQKNETEASDESSDSDIGDAYDAYNFKSALSIGSTFISTQLTIDSKPDDFLQMPFYLDSRGNLVGSFCLKSLVRDSSFVAFNILTSSKIPHKIVPKCGFLHPGQTL